MPPTEIAVSEKNGPTTVAPGLRDHSSGREEVIPISGFPRVLILDHIGRTTSVESPNLEKLKTLKRRQTRHRKSTSTASNSTGFDEISKMQAAVENPLNSDLMYPENAEDVSDWVQRRAAHRPRRQVYKPPHADISSSSSSLATSPTSTLHTEIFELPASNIVSTPDTPEAEVDEDETALRAAIALSLQECERNGSIERSYSTVQSELNENLERSKIEQ